MRTTCLLSLLSLTLTFAACGGDNKLELGGSCSLNSDCADGLLCKFGACHKACVKSLDCATGERCVQVDGVAVCQLVNEQACGKGCPTPLACSAADQTCRNTCSPTIYCLGGQVCTTGMCFEYGEADAGQGIDGGADTLTTPDAGLVAAGSFDSGLVAYYPFNGNARDESGNGNDGTANGTTLTTDRFGDENSAYYFDGTTNYIVVSNSDADSLNLTNSISICAWLKYSKLYDNPPLLYKVTNVGNGRWAGYTFQITNSKLDLQLFNGNTAKSVLSASSLSSGVWYYVVGTYDGNRAKLYVDGVLAGDIAASNAIGLGNSQVANIGRNVNFSNNIFSGTIDEISVYDRALTEDDINSFYHRGGWNGN